MEVGEKCWSPALGEESKVRRWLSPGRRGRGLAGDFLGAQAPLGSLGQGSYVEISVLVWFEVCVHMLFPSLSLSSRYQPCLWGPQFLWDIPFYSR